VKDRSESELPRLAKSNTDNDDPRRHIPYELIELPKRRKLRSDTDDPISTKSSTLRDDPSCATP
jgi:hypothetical protein